MLNNFSISKLSLHLILVAPFISQPAVYEKGLIHSFYKIDCSNFFHSFLYSKYNGIANFKDSSFSKFQGHSPIFLSSIEYENNYNKMQLLEEIKDSTELYDQQSFTNQLLFVEYGDISITFTNCKFDNCYNKDGPGGAISFRKGSASINIQACQFIKCSAQYNAGAIFIQVSNGGWIQGDANITNSLFQECYDCKTDSKYVAGVIQAFVAKTNNHSSFSLTDTQFNDCQFNVKNKITEGQLWLNANIFHINYNNISNNNEKIDASAFLFTKYVQEQSTLSFLNGINQRGFTFFEIYNVQGEFVHMHNINMINTTFTNFNEGAVMSKIAFFNVFFNAEKSFILDTFIAVDFTTISTDGDKSTKELVEPVIIQFPDNSKFPITFNIFSSKKFSDQNKIEYKIIENIKFEKGEVIGDFHRVDTPFQSAIPTELQTPSLSPTISETNYEQEPIFDSETYSESFIDDFEIKPQTTVIEDIKIETPKSSDITNNNNISNNSEKKKKLKGEVIAGIIIGIVVFAAIIVIIIVVVLQKKRNSLFQKSSNGHYNSEEETKNGIDDDKNNENSAELDSEVCYQNNKFWKKNDPLNLKDIINSINNYECSADDEDEGNNLSD